MFTYKYFYYTFNHKNLNYSIERASLLALYIKNIL